MIKKVLFYAAVALLVGNAAKAQQANTSTVRTDNFENEQGGYEKVANDAGAPDRTRATANKGTAQHSRLYNYADHLALFLFNPSITTDASYRTYPYMWFQPDMYSIYTGPSKDTVKLTSYGVVLHPWWSEWNSPLTYPTPGEMAIETRDPYIVDSIIAYGVYGRNPLKTGVVDTLRFAYSYGFGTGTNIPTYYYAGLAARYNVDTLFSAALPYDAAKHTMMKPGGSSGPNIVYKEILLKAGDTTRTAYSIATNMSVPAQNFFGVTVTFHSGDSYIPYSDTAFLSTSINPDRPYKYGMFRPRIIKETPSAFPSYQRRNYNSGQYRHLPESATNPGSYSPMWSWTSNSTQPSGYQYPYIDIHISCASCWPVSVANVSPAVIGNTYPNPAANSVTIPVTMNTAAEAKITLTNMLGQAMETRSLGKLNASQQIKPVFNTANLASGIYLVTVEANNARTTSRISVVH